jgi:hypothetical protein
MSQVISTNLIIGNATTNNFTIPNTAPTVVGQSLSASVIGTPSTLIWQAAPVVQTTGKSDAGPYYPVFVNSDATSTSIALDVDSTGALNYVPSTGTLSSTVFSGSFTGAATQIHTLAQTGNTNYYIVGVAADTTSNQAPDVDGNGVIYFNPNTSTINALKYNNQLPIGFTTTNGAQTIAASSNAQLLGTYAVNMGIATGTWTTSNTFTPTVTGAYECTLQFTLANASATSCKLELFVNGSSAFVLSGTNGIQDKLNSCSVVATLTASQTAYWKLTNNDAANSFVTVNIYQTWKLIHY